ncbi:DUF4494 domain-containing protein [Porphyromonas levii]|uniref:DUF4494 domain-containing protein n=1 Tax=Porphyromonas levii TaxID=28114 RepID=UPI00036137A8|nr:DUF4494 domain-containing protein [Porphyromonas levii]MBR8712313.1 hypothetical protein [Porphyromonas levii]MBR8714220.1 hypothetical protein [Porphyromonas levii]MBR8726762.1 hypothetical protein [Porphyromonas levii]MBR8735067.1 hypothetical protein [Porphyromonas levii]MBR8766018.1 hypothetical protein [Porphyromonas levii]
MSWFDCKITYEKEINHTGKMRKVSENYLIDAETITDAEDRIVEEMNGRGSFVMDSVKKVRLYDLFIDDKSERYYKCKVGFITLDEKAGVEKKKYVQMLVQADSIDLALEILHKGMKGTLRDYEVAAIKESSFMDVLNYKIKTR